MKLLSFNFSLLACVLSAPIYATDTSIEHVNTLPSSTLYSTVENTTEHRLVNAGEVETFIKERMTFSENTVTSSGDTAASEENTNTAEENTNATSLSSNSPFASPVTLNTPLQPNPLQQILLSGEANIHQMMAAPVVPVCPTLSTGNLYTLTATTAGTSACYHFNIPQRSKTNALVLSQQLGNNVNLSVVRHNLDNTFTLMGSSNNAGNANESVLTLTEPGEYYWFMDIVETTGAPFYFGASVATQLDAYEFNDTVATSTSLPDKQNVIKGSMDSASDIDYFDFTAVRGQDVLIKFEDEGSDQWVVEYYRNGWVPVTPYNIPPLNNLSIDEQIYVRVRANPNLPVNSVSKYTLTFGSKVTNRSNHTVSGEPNVNRVTYSGFRERNGLYATTQAYKTLTWGITLQDSTGHPVEGAKAILRVDKDAFDTSEGYVDYVNTSNSVGRVSGSINLGSCYGEFTYRHTEYSFGYKNLWETDLVYGIWRLEIPNTGNLELGVGGNNVEYVVLGHLCDQDLISSNPS